MARGRTIAKRTEFDTCNLLEASEEFYQHNRVKGLATETQKSYRIYVGCFVRWCGAETLLIDITPKILEDYIEKKMCDGNRPISIRTNMIHLRRFFNFCHSRSYMDKMDVMILRCEKTIKEPYTDDELRVLLERPKTNNWVEYRNWTMVNYFLGTGQRLSTVLNLKVSDFDLDNGRVRLRNNKDRIEKYMPLSTALVKVLKEYIELSGLCPEEHVFPEYEGKKLQRRSAQESIADYNKARGVQTTSIHRFRHSFAKCFLLNGGNPAQLQKLLNHKTISQTMQYVNLYLNDFSRDFDIYNPLDNIVRKQHHPVKRTTIVLKEV